MESPERRFVFTSCQAGAEPALKDELAREHPELRFAFSRPGFVTFKSPSELPKDFELRSVFARAHGFSLGESKAEDAAERARDAAQAAHSVAGGRPMKLHVWARDEALPPTRSEAPVEARSAFDDSEVMALAPLAEVALRDAAPGTFAPPGAPVAGDLVFDVIVVEPQHWFFGYHVHSARHSLDAGGRPMILLPPKAPSRAYLKLEEGLRWSAIELKPGERALEIGSAPGGATYALLQRGLDVVGNDPASMDPAVLAFGPGRFRHLKRGVADLIDSDLPDPIHWILLDMNVPPQIALDALEHVHELLPKGALLGVLLTLKLNRWRIAAEIPDFLTRLRGLGLARLAAAHLPSNRQEFFVAGLTPSGLSRAGSGPLRS